MSQASVLIFDQTRGESAGEGFERRIIHTGELMKI